MLKLNTDIFLSVSASDKHYPAPLCMEVFCDFGTKNKSSAAINWVGEQTGMPFPGRVI